MVLRIKADLTAEDREAWRRLALRREKAFRRKHRAAVRGWIGNKLWALFGIGFGVLGLYLSSFDRWPLSERIPVAVSSLLFVLCGVYVSVLDRYPAKPSGPFPGKGFPPAEIPDTEVRAAFFGDGRFAFWENGVKTRLGYSAVTGAWEDKSLFCLFFPDRPPLVLPKRGLGRWMPEDFRDFLERALDVPVERM